MKMARLLTFFLASLLLAFTACEKPYYATLDEAVRLQMNDQLEEALIVIDELLLDYPDDELLLVQRGIFKSELDDDEGAIDDFNKVLTINTGNDDARLSRALSYYAIADDKKAMLDIDYLLESKEKGTDVPIWTEELGTDYDFHISMTEIAHIHGLICVELERYDEALENFTLCIDAGFELPDVHYSRGETFILLDSLDKGCADLKMSRKLGFPEAQEIIDDFCD
ncbi:MAG: tetratricopeptide (TPR) repeat protein [Crocinitomicaceae bacterium]|jgi:tetratricopeptide (TPR) repeat protein